MYSYRLDRLHFIAIGSLSSNEEKTEPNDERTNNSYTLKFVCVRESCVRLFYSV